MTQKLFEKYNLSGLELKNRMAMAPLTRCRAINGNIPNEIMAKYYEQRAGAGLIIAEGTSPSPNGLGYTNIPGIFNKQQAEKWKLTTNAVHKKGGKIFLQMMHTGRVGHNDNLPEGGKVIGASAIAQNGEIKTYSGERKAYPIPYVLSTEEVKDCINEYIESAKLCVEAGFDGVEIHSAHGYLPNQFINATSNQRTDEYGGNIENRCKFVLEIAQKMCKAIGNEKVSIRISPFSYADGGIEEQEIIDTYLYLVKELDKLDLAYLHLSHMGEPQEVKFQLWKKIRTIYKGTLMLCGDFNKETAEKALQENQCDLVAFGRDFIANPDLVERFKNNWQLAERNRTEWYGNGASGYTDYPFYKTK